MMWSIQNNTCFMSFHKSSLSRTCDVLRNDLATSFGHPDAVAFLRAQISLHVSAPGGGQRLRFFERRPGSERRQWSAV